MGTWKCQVCGYVAEGVQPPEKCPKCGAPKEQFRQLTEREAELIARSRKSNYLHMRALTLLRDLIGVAEEIVQDNLDPTCVKIGNEVKEFATTAIQKVMAELEAHMKKGKWG